MMRIDAHHHVWDPARGDYGWLTPDTGLLYRSFGPEDLAPLLDACGVDGAILVQAAPTAAETDHLLAVARSTPWVWGVVGWIDFDAGSVVNRVAARAADPLFVGVRPMLQDMGDRRWILDPRHDPALKALAERGLVFDALVRADQIGVVAELAERHPILPIVLDHAGKPAVTAAGPDRGWIDDVARLASFENVACKLSGLLSEMPAGADPAWIAPYIAAVHQAFGGHRLLWGSDWPVLTAVGDYAAWHALAASLIPPDDHDAVFGSTAHRLYLRR
jgi:L-fuconolactonase